MSRSAWPWIMRGWHHWFFFGQTERPAERYISADPGWYTATAEHMGQEAYEDYLAAIHDCPVLFLWAAKDDLEDLYGDPLAIWRQWADDVCGGSIDCGHHIAEEAPADLASRLIEFFAPAC